MTKEKLTCVCANPRVVTSTTKTSYLTHCLNCGRSSGTQGYLSDSYDKWKEMYHKEEEVEDLIKKPAHYNTGDIECIDYIKSNLTREGYLGYLEGNTKKYMHRFKYKGNEVQDLEKAEWYLNKLKEEMKCS